MLARWVMLGVADFSGHDYSYGLYSYGSLGHARRRRLLGARLALYYIGHNYTGTPRYAATV